MSNGRLPGKGFRVAYSDPIIVDLMAALQGIYSSTLHNGGEAETAEVLDRYGFVYKEDDFGQVWWKVVEVNEASEIRVSLVRTTEGDYRLDMRTWFSPR